ncbi:cytochrome ubiquinol oxidase subunit I [Pseudogracilibacillus auburnensis]|uniref:Bd-type cytochrome oxidase subunit I n=1 Tax=Pseudogracilibacillus auburnensis TaxID=1494959 RepID=A0A2V3VWG5_9BACI|nr:cytochrome ubiquinol oxidase subunit I [Pseudogracilibacillus auburnensis]MBO1002280.1 cytochrome ubiquinol oxidase subunit I [Pseudogracilibacillus auburnensis]PXW86333.1 bd-type cytochrome oxidase subunit I [Pseudogracilibacillus auburnensis]
MLYVISIIPEDLELVIPGNVGFFEVLIVVSFLIHILFVNITVGSSALAVVQEIKGIRTKRAEDDMLAAQLATHTSILKSIAVVMGIAPLLLISVLYTQYFYPSTILIGKAWLSLLLILLVAFLFLYAYKFTWDKMTHIRKKRVHVLIGAVGSAMLLFVPLIFIVNVVSMLYPDMWEESKGFFHALTYYPQVWQRYIHFILASFAIAGFYLYFWNNRLQKKNGKNEQSKANLCMQKQGKRLGLQVMIGTTALQFIAGTWLLMNFEREIRLLYMGDDPFLTGLLLSSIFVTMILLFFLYLLMKHDKRKYFMMSLASFILVLGIMGWMRHELRETYIKPYKDEVPQTTEVQVNETNAE